MAGGLLKATAAVLIVTLILSALFLLINHPKQAGVSGQEISCDPTGNGNCTLLCQNSSCGNPPLISTPCQDCPPQNYSSFPNATIPRGHLNCSNGSAEQRALLKLIATNLTHPIRAKSPPNDDRLFIVDQVGVIRIVDRNGTLLERPFLDIRDQLVSLASSDERGLLGLAFSPNYSENGKFYVYYNAPLRPGGTEGWDNTVVLSEFKVSSDPNFADKSSERVLMMWDKPEPNHNGGDINFGPDGYLYIPTGDGGAGADSGNGHISTTGNAQSLSSPLGKILRIDVNNSTENRSFSIPPDNPFVNLPGALPSIYAYGFRNPISLTFNNGTMFATDAGQACWEEVDIVVRGGNYGWNLREGTHCFDPNDVSNCNASCRRTTGYHGETLIDPIMEVKNPGTGFAIAGGVVYHGSPSGLNGTYVFAIYEQTGAVYSACFNDSSGTWSYNLVNLTSNNTGPQEITKNGLVDSYILGLGQGSGNKTYLLTAQAAGPSGTTGSVWEIVPP